MGRFLDTACPLDQDIPSFASEGIQGGDEVEVDFSTGLITNITRGETYQAEPFPPFIRDMIAKGGLMASIKE